MTASTNTLEAKVGYIQHGGKKIKMLYTDMGKSMIEYTYAGQRHFVNKNRLKALT